ncbi:hypothetical protein MC885_019533, partial [Smutsia gigantea]
ACGDAAPKVPRAGPARSPRFPVGAAGERPQASRAALLTPSTEPEVSDLCAVSFPLPNAGAQRAQAPGEGSQPLSCLYRLLLALNYSTDLVSQQQLHPGQHGLGSLHILPTGFSRFGKCWVTLLLSHLLPRHNQFLPGRGELKPSAAPVPLEPGLPPLLPLVDLVL